MGPGYNKAVPQRSGACLVSPVVRHGFCRTARKLVWAMAFTGKVWVSLFFGSERVQPLPQDDCDYQYAGTCCLNRSRLPKPRCSPRTITITHLFSRPSLGYDLYVVTSQPLTNVFLVTPSFHTKAYIQWQPLILGVSLFRVPRGFTGFSVFMSSPYLISYTEVFRAAHNMSYGQNSFYEAK